MQAGPEGSYHGTVHCSLPTPVESFLGRNEELVTQHLLVSRKEFRPKLGDFTRRVTPRWRKSPASSCARLLLSSNHEHRGCARD
jgi:hypothetical protein